MQRISPLVLFIVASSAMVSFASCVGLYTIVAPQHIRPHIDYKVSLTLHDGNEPVTIRLSIQDGLQYKKEKEVTITSNKTKLVTLQIDDLDVSKGYKFVAEGISGHIFCNESSLRIESKEVSIFIQTDKAIYKPGETIKFRVLVLDQELKPVTTKTDNPLNIYFTDPHKNRIKQWIKVNPKMGVFTSEIQLSEMPILGNWKFNVQVGTEKKSKEIEVAEYVLPKFDVIIDSATAFSAKNDKIRVIIRSKYTYGKYLKGEAIVSLTSTSSYSYYRTKNQHQNEDSIVKTIPIDGKGNVEFDVENDLRIEFSEYSDQKNYELKAVVIEELTGRNESASKIITLHKTRYKIERLDSNHEFSPGLPLTFTISVNHHDNSPVLLIEETKWITVGKVLDRFNINEHVIYYKFELDENAKANIRIPTHSNETNFYLQIKYVDEVFDFGYFYPLSVAEPSELEAKVLTKRPTLNKNVFIEVQSSHLLQNFTYQIIGHGKLIYAENVAVPDRKYHVFKFKATFDLVPKATLIVYTVKNGDIFATRNEISIEDDLNNYVKLKLSTEETQPGKDISIDIITNSKSYVGLVGVDQSVLLLKSNDDLTKQEVFDEMNNYQNYLYPTEIGPWSVEPRQYLNDYFRPFEYSDFILFTNAKKDLYKVIAHRFHAYAHKTTTIRGGFNGVEAAYPSALAAVPMQYDTVQDRTDEGTIEPPRVRTEFPETWLWEDVDVDSSNGTSTLKKKVPDTITSWVISAFSVNNQFGLGLTKEPKTLKVFQPFFVSLNLPYSVKRGEVVALPVILFNYLNMDVTAELVLQNENDEFEFVDNIEDDQSFRKRQVSVSSNSGITQIFLIRFSSVGQISVKVTATSAVAGDAIERILQVDPEGIPQFINKAVFVDLRETDTFQTIQNVDVPEHAVADSLKINVNAIGDLLGGTIQNLHELIRLPTGCGEQNMLKFVPNVVVLDYLSAAGSIDPLIKDKAVKYLLSGYQRELSYRHINGSFSSFGKLDHKGSTWLTAFVAKSFKQAETYIDIDSKVIDDALKFLSEVQAADGSFPEIGQVSHQAMQGGSNKGVALTAYTAIAFLRNKKSNDWKYEEVVTKAINNIVSNLKEIDDPYTEAVVVYALQAAGHPTKDQALNDLIGKSKVKDQLKWWSKSKPNQRPSDSINIEITSYGLLALIEAERFVDALPYFRWLLSKRNDRGGFVGTQDTIIGLESLARYGQFLSNKESKVELKVHADSTEDHILTVNNENGLVLQTVDMPSDTKSVRISASGRGFALVQLSYRYNLNQSDVYETFTLEPKVLETTAGHLRVQICSRFNPKDENELHSNMVIVEVEMPSGFLIEKDRLNEFLMKQHIKLVETTNGETVAHIYFDQMLANEEICLEVQGYRSHKVAENKPVPVKIYDYYDSSRSAREFYEIPLITSCDICQESCSKSCKK